MTLHRKQEKSLYLHLLGNWLVFRDVVADVLLLESEIIPDHFKCFNGLHNIRVVLSEYLVQLLVILLPFLAPLTNDKLLLQFSINLCETWETFRAHQWKHNVYNRIVDFGLNFFLWGTKYLKFWTFVHHSLVFKTSDLGLNERHK